MASVSLSLQAYGTGKTSVSPPSELVKRHPLTHVLRAVTAAHALDSKLPTGDASYDSSKVVYSIRYETAKSDRILGLKYRGLEEATKDLVEQFKSRGWY